MKPRKFSVIICTIFAILTVLACPQYSEAAKLSTNSATIEVGNTTVIKVLLNFNNDKVKWKTSNHNIKIIKKNNKQVTIKGLEVGKSTLKARIGKKNYKCWVTVSKKEIVEYEISDKEVFYKYDDDLCDGYYQAFVEITNTGNVPLYLGDATFDLEDSNGSLIATDDDVSTAPDFIYPGEKGYYYNQFGTPVNMNKDKFNSLSFVPHINVVKATNTLSHDYKIYDLSLGSDSVFNVPAVVGRFKNDTSENLRNIYLDVLFYDGDRKIIGISGTNLYDIATGQEKSFSVSSIFAGIQAGKRISNFKVYARGTYYQFS